MIINFIGNYQAGYVGEVSDETHLARELESYGHTVRRIPRDEWREYVIEGFPKGKYPNIPDSLKADINLIAKWGHFYNGDFIHALRAKSEASVMYWVWDYMWDQGFPDWHLAMAQAADLYLTNEGGLFKEYQNKGVNPYYFPFDVCDGEIKRSIRGFPEKYNVTFTGSYLGQGDRIEMIKEINKSHPVTVFSWNHQEWDKIGIKANPPVWGQVFNQVVADSKIMLGFNVNAHSWGYWSNRIGKTLRAGGFLLQQYAPGMELLYGNKIEYFSTTEEAIDKIGYFLGKDHERKQKIWNLQVESEQYTSKYRIEQLSILMERFVKERGGQTWNRLP